MNLSHSIQNSKHFTGNFGPELSTLNMTLNDIACLGCVISSVFVVYILIVHTVKVLFMSESQLAWGWIWKSKRHFWSIFILHIWEFLRPNKLFFSLHRMAQRREITEIDGNVNYWKIMRSDRWCFLLIARKFTLYFKDN